MADPALVIETPLVLTPSAQAALLSTEEVRLHRIQTDCFIPTPGTDAGLTLLEREFARPRVIRQPGIRIIGDPYSGKTAMIDKFLRDHPRIDRPDQETDEIPVIRLEINSPSIIVFLSNIVKALGSNVLSSHEAGLARHLDACFGAIKPRMMIVDEVHVCLTGTRVQRDKIWNYLKWIGNAHKVTVVLAGTDELRTAIDRAEERNTRIIYSHVMPVWNYDAEWLRFANRVRATLPLRRDYNLWTDTELSRFVFHASNALTGQLVLILREAAAIAISSGIEMINMRVLKETIGRLDLRLSTR